MVDTILVLKGHLGAGLIAMAGFSYGFARNCIQTKNMEIRRFKSLTFLISFMTMFYYLILNVLYNTSNPTLRFMEPVTLRYLNWGLTTPLILTDILLLDTPVLMDILSISIFDIIMIVSGYIAFLATDPVAIWSIFGFGAFNGGIVIYRIMEKIGKVAIHGPRSIAQRALIFLAWYILITWCFFPVLFVLRKLDYISQEVELYCYVYLDIFAKCGLGTLIVGARDAIHAVNSKGRMVRFAKAVISIVPIERTDSSVVPAPTDTEIASMVGTSTPVDTTERAATNVDDQQDSVLTIKNTNLVDTPPPRWQ